MSQLSSIKKTNEFSRVYRRGKRLKNPWFDLVFKVNGIEENRLGISVSKKVGNSVQRHRLARITRAAFAEQNLAGRQTCDYVVVWRQYDDALTSRDVSIMISELL